MSLFKGPDGIYHADVRVAGVGRWHGSMRTRKKSEAQPRYDAVKRLFREAKGPNGAERRALIDDLRSGKLAIERLESMVANGEQLAPVQLATSTAAAWPTVDDAITRYVNWIDVNPTRRAATWRAAKTQLRKFADFVFEDVRTGTLTLDAVTSARSEAYQRSLIDAGHPSNTVTAYVSRVGALWAWIQRRENRSAIEQRRDAVVIHSPLDPETTARERSARDRWLTKEEATALIAVTPPRLRFIVAAGLLGGFRAGEILHLRTHADIDLELGTISVSPKQIGVDDDGAPIYWKPKTKRSERVVPIVPDLMPIVEEHIAAFASSDWMMPSIEDPGVPFPYITFHSHFEQIVKDAGLVVGRKDPRGVVFHTLRHTFASWLVMAGVDLYPVAKLLGDTLQMVEDTYAHLAPDFKRRAIEALKGAIAIPPFEKSATESATTEARSMPNKGQYSYPGCNAETAGDSVEFPETAGNQPFKESGGKGGNSGNRGMSEVPPQKAPQVGARR